MTTTEERVIAITQEHLQPDPAKHTITTATKFAEDLGADSLDVVELAMAMEEEFSIALDDSEIEKLVTVEDVVNLVTQKQAV